MIISVPPEKGGTLQTVKKSPDVVRAFFDSPTESDENPVFLSLSPPAGG